MGKVTCWEEGDRLRGFRGGVGWGEAKQGWFVGEADEADSVPHPAAVNLKIAFERVFGGDVYIAPYPRADAEALRLGACFCGDLKGPANSTLLEVGRVDSVIEFFGFARHALSVRR